MTVNPIVTPVPSVDDAAASIETPTTRSHEENECCRWFSRLMAGESLDDADIQRLKSNDSSEETMIPLLDRRLVESSLAETDASSSSTTTAGQFQLVRVRGGFCQDMFQSEYFETSSSSSSSSSNTNSPSLAERTPLFITPIPFSTPWFRNYSLSSENNPNAEHRDKRIRPNASACSNSNMMMDHNDKPPSASNDDDDAADTTALSSSWWNSSTMKSDPEQVPVLAEFYYDQYRWNNGSSNKVRLNDIVEMIGILEYSSSFSSGGEDSEQDAEMKDDNNDSVAPADMEIENTAFWDDHEETPTKVPNSIPRLHVIWFRSLDFDSIAAQALCCHSSSIVPPPAAVPADNYANDEAASRMLAAALSIDQVSASAIYLNLLSMAERQQASSSSGGGAPVVNKTPQGTTLGCSSLNLVLPNHEACSQFQQALEQVLSQIVPAVNSIHLVGRDNSLALLPTQKRGRIEPTPLQLPQGATLIINTSATDATTTTSTTAAAALDPSTSQALEMLTSNHHLPYQFDGGVTIPFEADVRVFVLSVAAGAGPYSSSSKLPCTMQAACSFTGMDNDASPNFHLSEQDAMFLRQSLTRARSGVDWQAKNIGLPKAVLERAQQDFIQRRTAFREQKESDAKGSISSSSGLPGEGELHRWLTWTRLLARQRRGNKLTGSGAGGQDTAVAATIQDWERALVLDDALVDSMSTTGKK